MKQLLIILAISLLAGCSTISDAIGKRLENRAVCTMDKMEAHVISKWWMFSIGAMLAKSDAEAICK